MSKAYLNYDVISEVSTAILLLTWEHGSCTPTDVLRLLAWDESKFARTFVLNWAQYEGYVTKKSGRGWRISCDEQ